MKKISNFQFPISNFTYLDSAASTLTPTVVLDATNDYYTKYRANVHRGVYESSIKATEKYEEARANVARFINAKPEEIIFTSGTTQSLNQLAYSLSPRLSHRDNVVLTRTEHHANLIPWQQMAKHYGFEIRYINIKNVIPTSREESLSQSRVGQGSLGVNPLGMTSGLDLTSAANLIDENTKIVSLTYVSNVLGTVNPVEKIIKLAKQKNPNIYIIVDAAQAVAHIPVDVQKLGCDFLAFSGHKMYGPTGIGVLYGKKELLEEHLEPFFFGGEMVKSVSYEGAEWNDVPHKFEAGTPNIAGAIGLGTAVQFMESIGWEKIQKHERSLTNELIEQLHAIGVRLVCHPDSPAGEEGSLKPASERDSSVAVTLPQNDNVGIVSFTIDGIHPHDIAEILSHEGVAVRAGFHCAEPLHKYLGLNQGTVRVSLGIYNTEKDIEKLVKGIEKVKNIFRLQATS